EDQRTHDNQDDGEPADGTEVAAEVHGRHRDGGRVEQRGQQSGEDQLRLDHDLRCEREQAYHDPDDDEDQRGGDAVAVGDDGTSCDDEQAEYDDDQWFHGPLHHVSHPYRTTVR